MVRVSVIGIGADGDMTGAARRRLAEVALVAGVARHLDLLADVRKDRYLLEGELAKAIATLLAVERRPLAVLASGDPNFFGVAALVRRLAEGEPVEVFPYVSSMQLAFARAGLPWHDAVFLSAHGRPLAPVVARARRARKFAVLTDPDHTAGKVAQALLAAGVEPEALAILCERLGMPDEEVTTTTLAQVPAKGGDPLSVLIVLRPEAGGGPPLHFGQAAERFWHHDRQVTKGEVRAVVLGKLRLRPYGVLWDIGAGTGSVAVEASMLVPEARIYAVEAVPEKAEAIRRNLEAGFAENVVVVVGEAPEALADLPEPHSIFLGGSKGRLEEILAVVAERLAAGGSFVATFAYLERAAAALAFLERRGLSGELLLLQVARAVPGAGGHRLTPEHPVFVVAAVREEGRDAAAEAQGGKGGG